MTYPRKYVSSCQEIWCESDPWILSTPLSFAESCRESDGEVDGSLPVHGRCAPSLISDYAGIKAHMNFSLHKLVEDARSITKLEGGEVNWSDSFSTRKLLSIYEGVFLNHVKWVRWIMIVHDTVPCLQSSGWNSMEDFSTQWRYRAWIFTYHMSISYEPRLDLSQGNA